MFLVFVPANPLSVASVSVELQHLISVAFGSAGCAGSPVSEMLVELSGNRISVSFREDIWTVFVTLTALFRLAVSSDTRQVGGMTTCHSKCRPIADELWKEVGGAW